MSRIWFVVVVGVLSGWLSGCAARSPTSSPTTIALWPGAIPDSWPVDGPEYTVVVRRPLVAHRTWTAVGRVSHPTLTLYPARMPRTRAAVIVFPGGGYEELAIDLEGTEVCDWLTARGITCIVVKYRVPGTSLYPAVAPYPKSGPYPESPIALEDAQRAMRIVRAHASQWSLDPHRIGVIGFSAGGHLVAALSNYFAVALYKPVDRADRLSARPDFAAAIYPGHLSAGAVLWDERQMPRGRRLNADMRVTAQAPPTFLLQAKDDNVDGVGNALAYYVALRDARVPVELHLYARGGHAFGLRRSGFPISHWPDIFYSWLKRLGVI